MSEEIEDDDLELDDDEFGEFDDDLGGFGEEPMNEPPKNGREAVVQTITRTGSSFVDEFADDKLESATEIAKNAIPESLSTQANIASEINDTVKDNVSEAYDQVRKEANQTFKIVKKLVPENSERINAVVNKIGDIFGLEDEDSYSRGPSKEQIQLEAITSEINSVMGEKSDGETKEQLLRDQIAQNQHKSEMELASTTASNLNALRLFNNDVANTYYRKNLEIGLKTLYVQKDQMELMKSAFDTFKNQFESIVKNTALPDIVKTRDKEVMAHAFKQKAMDNVMDAVGKATPMGAFKNNFKAKVDDVRDKAISALSGANSGIEMLASDDMGLTKEQLLASLLAGVAKEKTGKFFGKQIEKTDTGKEFISKITGMGTDVEAVLKKAASNTDSDIANNLLMGMSELFNNKQRDKYTLQKQDLNDVTLFDKRVHSSIVKVIPGLLSKIYGEIKSIRTKDNAPKDNELYYDHDSNEFLTAKQQDKKLETTYKTKVEKNVGVPSQRIVSALMTKGGLALTKLQRSELTQSLVDYLVVNKGSQNFEGIESNKFIKTLPKGMKEQFKVAIKKIRKDSKKVGKPEISDNAISAMNTINTSMAEIYQGASKTNMKNELTELDNMGHNRAIRKFGITKTDELSGEESLDTKKLDSRLRNVTSKLNLDKIDKFEDDRIKKEEEAKKEAEEKKKNSLTGKAKAKFKPKFYNGGYVPGYATGGLVKPRLSIKDKLDSKRNRRAGIVKTSDRVEEARKSREDRYTGDGGKFTPAGVVHKGEYVFSKESLKELLTSIKTGDSVGIKEQLTKVSKDVSKFSKNMQTKAVATDAYKYIDKNTKGLQDILSTNYKLIKEHTDRLSSTITGGLSSTITSTSKYFTDTFNTVKDSASNAFTSLSKDYKEIGIKGMATKVKDASVVKLNQAMGSGTGKYLVDKANVVKDSKTGKYVINNTGSAVKTVTEAGKSLNKDYQELGLVGAAAKVKDASVVKLNQATGSETGKYLIDKANTAKDSKTGRYVINSTRSAVKTVKDSKYYEPTEKVVLATVDKGVKTISNAVNGEDRKEISDSGINKDDINNTNVKDYLNGLYTKEEIVALKKLWKRNYKNKNWITFVKEDSYRIINSRKSNIFSKRGFKDIDKSKAGVLGSKIADSSKIYYKSTKENVIDTSALAILNGYTDETIDRLKAIWKKDYPKKTWSKFIIQDSIKVLGKDGVVDNLKVKATTAKNNVVDNTKLYADKAANTKAGKKVKSAYDTSSNYVHDKTETGLDYVKNKYQHRVDKQDAHVGYYGEDKTIENVMTSSEIKNHRKIWKKLHKDKTWNEYLEIQAEQYRDRLKEEDTKDTLLNKINIHNKGVRRESKRELIAKGKSISQSIGMIKDAITDTLFKKEDDIEYTSKYGDYTDEQKDGLKSEFFSSEEYQSGNITNYYKWLRQSKLIDTGDRKTQLTGLMKSIKDKVDVFGKVKTKFNKAKDEIVSELIGKITGTGTKELTLDQEKSMREEFYRTREYKDGLVTNFDEWLESFGYKRNGTGILGRIKKAFTLKSILKKTRKLDRAIAKGAVKLAGKGVKNGVKYGLKGAWLGTKLGAGLGLGTAKYAGGGVLSAGNSAVRGLTGLSLSPDDMPTNKTRLINTMHGHGLLSNGLIGRSIKGLATIPISGAKKIGDISAKASDSIADKFRTPEQKVINQQAKLEAEYAKERKQSEHDALYNDDAKPGLFGKIVKNGVKYGAKGAWLGTKLGVGLGLGTAKYAGGGVLSAGNSAVRGLTGLSLSPDDMPTNKTRLINTSHGEGLLSNGLIGRSVKGLVNIPINSIKKVSNLSTGIGDNVSEEVGDYNGKDSKLKRDETKLAKNKEKASVHDKAEHKKKEELKPNGIDRLINYFKKEKVTKQEALDKKEKASKKVEKAKAKKEHSVKNKNRFLSMLGKDDPKKKDTNSDNKPNKFFGAIKKGGKSLLTPTTVLLGISVAMNAMGITFKDVKGGVKAIGTVLGSIWDTLKWGFNKLSKGFGYLRTIPDRMSLALGKMLPENFGGMSDDEIKANEAKIAAMDDGTYDDKYTKSGKKRLSPEEIRKYEKKNGVGSYNKYLANEKIDVGDVDSLTGRDMAMGAGMTVVGGAVLKSATFGLVDTNKMLYKGVKGTAKLGAKTAKLGAKAANFGLKKAGGVAGKKATAKLAEKATAGALSKATAKTGTTSTKAGKLASKLTSVPKKKGMIKRIKVLLKLLKKRVIKKLGIKAGAKLVGKIASRFIPFVGWGLLAYDATMVIKYMVSDKMDFKGAVSKAIIGFNVFDDFDTPVDEDGNPIKPDIPVSTKNKYDDDDYINAEMADNDEDEQKARMLRARKRNRIRSNNSRYKNTNTYGSMSDYVGGSKSNFKPANNKLYKQDNGDGVIKETKVKTDGGGNPKSTPMANGALVKPDGGFNKLVIPKGVRVDGFKPAFADNLASMANEYNDITGKKIPINSGYRSYEDQLALKKKYGSKAASPGKSMHEFGLAFDTNTNAANELDKLGLMKKYGFTRPVGKETWHVESAGTQENIPKAKKNPEYANNAVANSIGAGGEGWGTVRGARKYSRNKKYQEKLISLKSYLNTDEPANNVKSTKPAKSKVKDIKHVTNNIPTKPIVDKKVKLDKRAKLSDVADIEKPTARINSKSTTKHVKQENKTVKKNTAVIDKHQKEALAHTAKISESTATSVDLQNQMIGILGNISDKLNNGLDVNNLSSIPQPNIVVNKEEVKVANNQNKHSDLPKPTVNIQRKKYTS